MNKYIYKEVCEIERSNPIKEFFKLVGSLITDRNIIYMLAVSVFLPYQFTAVIIAVTAVMLLISPKTNQRIFVHRGSRWLLLFFALIIIVSIIYHNWAGLAAGFFIIFVTVIGLYVRSAFTVNIYEHTLDIITMLSIPIGLVAILERIFLKIFDPGNKDNFRCVSVFLNSNYFATVVAIVIIVCAYKAGTHQGVQLKYFAIAGLNMVSAYLSGSLFVWVEIFVGVALVFFLLHKHEMVSGLLLGAGLFCFLIYFAPGIFLPRLAESPLTTDRRLDIWTTAIQAFFKTPLFGEGPLTYYHIYSDYPTGFATSHAHNIFLDPLLSYGIIGTAVLCVYVVCTLMTLLKCLRLRPDGRITVLICAVVAAAAVHGITDVTLLWVQTGLLFMLIIGGINLAEKRSLRQGLR